MSSQDASLVNIEPANIQPNPDNPRLVFRERDMIELLESIREVGIQVPISVYRETNHYVLLDGERRWRCAHKLNLKTVPAIVLPKPSRLENLLMMFNIHNVRVNWDLMPMALKLRDIAQLLGHQNKSTSPKDLAGVTGLPLSTVRRLQDLLQLPQKYQDLLLGEAEKPRDQQVVTADLFVEIGKARNVIARYVPDVYDHVSPEQFTDAMVDKYISGTVNNVVAFRQVSKIARAELAGEEKTEAAAIIHRLVTDKDYSVDDAYEDTVRAAYEIRDLTRKVSGLSSALDSYQGRMSEELATGLRELRKAVDRALARCR